VYAMVGPRDTPVPELIARATAAANRAIELDPRMGEPYAALGKLRAYDWDWSGAERNYRKAIELSPGYAPSRYWLGPSWPTRRRCIEALEQAHEAERLDPVSSARTRWPVDAQRSRPGSRSPTPGKGASRKRRLLPNTLAARHAKDKVLASAWSVAMVQAGLQNDEAALTWLEHAYTDREEWLEALGADERFRGLHTNDRFERLRDRLGLGGGDDRKH
jgi:tetratricopeptide (TPR) repeat protein